MKNRILLLFLTFLRFFVCAQTVEIVSDMYTEEILRDACFEKVKEHYDLRITDQTYSVPITPVQDSIKRYLIFNILYEIPELEMCDPEKKVLFMMEPIRIPMEKALKYGRVYTWDDDMIDNKKYFKFYFPDMLPMDEQDLIAFESKKLSTMIVRNWHPEHRRSIVAFFSTLPKGEFEFYGSPFPKLLYSKYYKGRIPGLNCGREKINILKNYRFCFCFENTTDLRGYITEKIFPCFAAGCVPIYWGAPNVDEYIPKECYIDYRNFQSNEELYMFIKTMPEEVYVKYLDHIRLFLESDQAKLFSPQAFAQILLDAVNQEVCHE